MTVVGARPQLIKASVVSAAFRSADGITEDLVHTGQHFDRNMSAVFFEELGLVPPTIHLGIHGGGHGEMVGRMLIALEDLLTREAPDIVLVYGDTNSTLAGGLTAAKLHIPVAHVEAGLRSFNPRMPEETNRVLTDHVSTWLFAPTSQAVENLRREGLDADTIHQVGDVMYDVALRFARRASESGEGLLRSLGLEEEAYVLVTVHRAENTDSRDRLEVIAGALEALTREMDVVCPLHPRTRDALDRAGRLSDLEDALIILEPQGYLDMVTLERHATVVATDSGGVQKEAYFHRVPCVTLRDETEWTELVELGWNRVVPPTSVEEVRNAILDAVGRAGDDGDPYGDGEAAVRIVKRLKESRP